jgi:hypothetical protein
MGHVKMHTEDRRENAHKKMHQITDILNQVTFQSRNTSCVSSTSCSILSSANNT